MGEFDSFWPTLHFTLHWSVSNISDYSTTLPSLTESEREREEVKERE